MPSDVPDGHIGHGPTILLNDTPIRQSSEFLDRLPSEEAGLMTDDEAFYYDRNYSRRNHFQHSISKAWLSLRRNLGLSETAWKSNSSPHRLSNPRRGLRRLGYVVVAVLVCLGIMQLFHIGGNAYVALFPGHRNVVIDSWRQIGKDNSPLEHWPTDLTRDVLPIKCHSHNDYWRAVPLYSGLSAGCIGTEADVWLIDGELYVGHDESSLTPNRTLSSLYIEPLVDILGKQNPTTKFVPDGAAGFNGVFDTDREQVLTLLIDLKTDDAGTFEAVVEALDPLRSKGYLTHFDGSRVVERPIRIVGTGNTRFSSVISDRNLHRDIFMDAPARDMWAEPDSTDDDGKLNDTHEHGYGEMQERTNAAAEYSPANSYYASDSFTDAIGHMWGWSLSSSQLYRLRGQIKGAHEKGLKIRYWETPAWPVSRRNALWEILVREGADILNVDDLKGAVDEDWRRAGRWWD